MTARCVWLDSPGCTIWVDQSGVSHGNENNGARREEHKIGARNWILLITVIFRCRATRR